MSSISSVALVTSDGEAFHNGVDEIRWQRAHRVTTDHARRWSVPPCDSSAQLPALPGDPKQPENRFAGEALAGGPRRAVEAHWYSPFQISSSRSWRPIAIAARWRVCNVTLVLVGSSKRSSALRLVCMRIAMAALVRRSFSMAALI